MTPTGPRTAAPRGEGDRPDGRTCRALYIPLRAGGRLVDRPASHRLEPAQADRGRGEELERRSQPVHVGLRLTVMGWRPRGLLDHGRPALVPPSAARPSHQGGERPHQPIVYVTPPRGLVLSRNGVVLVANKVMAVVTLNRQDAANDPGLVQHWRRARHDDDGDRRRPERPAGRPLRAGAGRHRRDRRHDPLPSPSTPLMLPGVVVSYVAERTYPEESPRRPDARVRLGHQRRGAEGALERGLPGERRHRAGRRGGAVRAVPARQARQGGAQGGRPRGRRRHGVGDGRHAGRRRRPEHRHRAGGGGAESAL